LVVTGALRQRLVDIVGARPDGIAIGDLVDRVYADDPDGGPLTAPRSVNVLIHRANAQLAAQGYQIKAMCSAAVRAIGWSGSRQPRSRSATRFSRQMQKGRRTHPAAQGTSDMRNEAKPKTENLPAAAEGANIAAEEAARDGRRP
jgi:hypothetical protein